MEAQTFLDNVGTIAEAPGGVDRLRDLVLDLAVRGRLVQQDPTDESATDLLRRIEADRHTKTIDGVRRRSRNVGGEVEQPHSIPVSWTWCRLDEIAVYNGRDKVPAPSVPADAWILDLEDIEKSTSRLLHRASCAERRPTSTKSAFKPGDVLFGKLRPYLDKVLIADRDGFATTEIVPIVPLEGVTPEWIRLSLKSPRFRQFVVDVSYGMKMPRLGTKDAESSVHPLPPTSEQLRIAAKVDELMRLCDGLEARQYTRHHIATRLRATSLDALTNAQTIDDFHAAWSRLRANWESLTGHTDSVAALRQTILQLAVRGMLVERDSSSASTAEDLVETTRPHSDELSKTQALRRPNRMTSVSELPKPFDLPAGWTWARFSELGELARGRSQHRPRNDPALYTDGSVPLIQTGDVARADGQIDTWSALYNHRGVEQSRIWPRGTLCITIAANIADTALLAFDACFPDSVVGFVPFEPIPDARYFEYFMRTAQADLEHFAPSTAQKNINLAVLDELLIPLPPLSEMMLIVDRVETLMSLCDDLEHALIERNSTSLRLAESLAGGTRTASS
jgi:type I restriction enzyme S subunit